MLYMKKPPIGGFFVKYWWYFAILNKADFLSYFGTRKDSCTREVAS